MLEFRTGDIFSQNTQAIVNPVNCVGVMGRGLALQFKNKFHANHESYVKACQRGQLWPGKMLIHKENGLYVINFPTKRHWKDKSLIQDIDAGLTAMVADIYNLGIKSIAIPPLGCGLGGLMWRDVRNIMEKSLNLQDVHVIVLEPS